MVSQCIQPVSYGCTFGCHPSLCKPSSPPPRAPHTSSPHPADPVSLESGSPCPCLTAVPPPTRTGLHSSSHPATPTCMATLIPHVSELLAPLGPPARNPSAPPLSSPRGNPNIYLVALFTRSCELPDRLQISLGGLQAGRVGQPMDGIAGVVQRGTRKIQPGVLSVWLQTPQSVHPCGAPMLRREPHQQV